MKKFGFVLYGIISYFLFFGTVLYMMGFVGNYFVPKSIDVGPSAPVILALAVNLGWIFIFGLHHTITARPAFKERFTKIVPEPIERSTYVLLSSLLLIIMFYFWIPITGTIWSIENTAGAYALHGLYLLGWVIVFASTFIIDHFDLFGLKQVYLNFTDKKMPKPVFQVKFLYKLCRHPLMLGWIMLFWATPVMTVGHLIFAVGMSAYIFIALKYEEDDLVNLFGKDYLKYQQEVLKICPFAKFGRNSQKTKKAVS